MTQEIEELLNFFYEGGDLPGTADNTTEEHVALIIANQENIKGDFITSKRDLNEGFPAKFTATAFVAAKRGGKYIWDTTNDRVNNPCGQIGEHIIEVLLAKGVEIIRIHFDEDPFHTITKAEKKDCLFIISKTILKKLRETDAGQSFLDSAISVVECPGNVEFPRKGILSFMRSLFHR